MTKWGPTPFSFSLSSDLCGSAALCSIPLGTRFLLALTLVLALGRAATAHPLEVGNLKLDSNGADISLSIDLDTSVAATVLDANAPVDAERLANATYRLAPIAGCTWRGATARTHGRSVIVTDHATCSPALTELRWSFPFVTRVSPTFQLLVNAHVLGQDRVVLLDRTTQSLVIAGDAPSVSLTSFVGKGVEHIGAAPSQWHDARGFHLPDGIDHIAFLLGLLLAGGSIARLLKVATGFTIGHTITLALATLGVLRPPACVIEPLIALTIAFVAIEALTAKLDKHRWKIATAFGLVHGFGFANALTALHLSRGTMVKALFGYNLGVELGQVALVLAIAPIVALLHRSPRGRPIIQLLAAAIFVLGMFWFFTRL